jgi:hypothetical protein
MNNDRIQRLSNLRQELEDLPAEPWSGIKSWVAKAIPVLRNDWPSFFSDFQQVARDPKWAFLPRVGGDEGYNIRARTSEQTMNKARAENAKQEVISFLDGLLTTAPAQQPATALDTVVLLCKRFPVFVRQLGSRREGRPALEIKDEYDVQYLLLALLRLHFDDVRPETWTPSYAGSSSRMDFLLKPEKTVIEVKKTRDTLRDRQVGDQLIIDIDRYGQYPDCQTLVCFVYDADGRLDNPRGLEQDLSGSRNNINVLVLVSPSGV